MRLPQSMMAAATLALLQNAAFAQAPASLSGKVGSTDENAMEGVLVSAKKGIVTVSVMSDKNGQFTFPKDRLGAGEYTLSIRATGYNLEGPKTVKVEADKPAAVDVKLVKTKNLSAQLTNAEWMMSAPGTDEQKRTLSGCTNCHSVERIVNASYNAGEMLDVIKRMAQYSNNSFYKKPQIRAAVRDINAFVPNADKVAAWFASINRSEGERTWELKTMPRLTGDSTRVIITEYDLPDQTIQPHDVLVDPDGVVWHSDFSGQILGRLDTKTLEHKSFPVPLQRQGWPTGALNLEQDPEGNLWMALMFQAGVAKFDRKTQQFTMFQLPADQLKEDSQQAFVGPQNWTVDGKVWLQDPARHGVYRMEVATKKSELFLPWAGRGNGSPYQIIADKENNIWMLNFSGEDLTKIDAKTGQTSFYPTPTKRSRPRRGKIGDDGRIAFAEFAGDKVGIFDPKTEKYQEWNVPGAFYAPYQAATDKTGHIWTGSMNTDRIVRVDMASGKTVEYQLPHYTNVRGLVVDNSHDKPALWLGNNHGAAIIKVEPMD